MSTPTLPASAPRATQTLAFVAVAGAVLTWGCSNVVIKIISASGLVSSFYRLWLAIPLLWLVPLLVPHGRRRLDRDWLEASCWGGLLFAVHQLLFFSSLKLTSVANVSIIGALQPALVLLVAGPMFGEVVTGGAIWWSAVAVVGTIMVVMGSTGSVGWSPFGDVLAVANLFAFTAYFLASKRFRARVGAFEYVMGMTTVAGLVILAVALLSGQELLSPRGRDWALLLFLAVFPGTLGHVLTNWAHPYVSALLLSIMLLAVPVLASVGAAVFLDEPLNALHLCGGGVVPLAIGRVVRSARSAPEELAESAAATDAP